MNQGATGKGKGGNSGASLLLAAAWCLPFLFSLFFSLFPPSARVFAEGPKEQYKKIQKEMEEHRRGLEDAKKKEHSVLEEIDTVNMRMDAIEAELRKQRLRIHRTESEITKVEAEISVNREELSRKKAWMRRKLRTMQRYGQSYELLLLMAGADDMAQIMRRWKYLEVMTLQERRAIDGYVSALRALEEREGQLQNLRADLKRSEERLRLTEEAFSEKRREREHLLVSVRSEKSSHEKMLSELQEAAKRLRDVIRRLEEKETYEGMGFAALKGKLPWPVAGKVAIPYGTQKDPRFNTPVFRNGIYIKTEDDTIKAVQGGKVVFAEWFKGYGNLLILNHGEGYHTLYANLSEIFFGVGDIIKQYAVVGRVGESGMLNAPSLYFEIRYKGKPLDPVQWLKRR
ncbi:MAG TPA: peptidoglycan DD-metalloendopeptidase family protein [Thermodesulfovibrionales bacterium]|nr:peptidoglycan DD-metalloendopeptidase family protein [Thermodesulfovibrionales bacterium]